MRILLGVVVKSKLMFRSGHAVPLLSNNVRFEFSLSDVLQGRQPARWARLALHRAARLTLRAAVLGRFGAVMALVLGDPLSGAGSIRALTEPGSHPIRVTIPVACAVPALNPCINHDQVSQRRSSAWVELDGAEWPQQPRMAERPGLSCRHREADLHRRSSVATTDRSVRLRRACRP